MTDKETKFLKDWTIRYVKNRDLIAKKITAIKDENSDFVVVKGELEHKYFIRPFLNDTEKILNEIKEYKHGKSLVCFHTRENFNLLLEKWGVFVDMGRNFAVIFINPFSKTDKVLSLCPYTHHLISDEETLKQGLKTMAENVEFTTEEEVRKIINS